MNYKSICPEGMMSIISTAIAAGLAATCVASQEVTILCSNDTHSHINDAAVPFSAVAQMKRDLEDAGQTVFLVDAGDFLQGTSCGVYDHGASVVEIMATAGYDAVAPGNHEFDFGTSNFLAIAEGHAGIKFVCANLFETNGATGEVTFPLAKSVVFEKGGLRVGFVGVTTPATINSSDPKNFMDDTSTYYRYDFIGRKRPADFFAAVQEEVDSVATKADVVVVLGHLGEDEANFRNIDFVNNVTNFCVLVDGHSHTEIPGRVVTNSVGREVTIVQTGTALNSVGKFTLSVDGASSVELVRSYSATNEAVRVLETNLIAKVDAWLGGKVAELPEPLCDSIGDRRRVRSGETNLGDFCADAIWWYLNEKDAGGCDLALVGGGSIRATVPAGDVSLASLLTVFPLGGKVTLVSATGQTILDALEFGVRECELNENSAFLHAAGLRFSAVTNIPTKVVTDGSVWISGPVGGEYRVRDVKVFNRTTGAWDDLDLAKTYRVGLFNSLSTGYIDGTRMWTNAELIGENYGTDYLVMAEYAKAFAQGQGGSPVISSENSPLASFGSYLVNYGNPTGAARAAMLQDGEGIDVLDWAASEPMDLVNNKSTGPLIVHESVAEDLPPLPEGAFTYAVFGDTQCYKDSVGTEISVDNPSFCHRVDWILENKDAQNIVFVSHLGDIVDNPGVTDQWAFASQQMKRFDDAGIHYGIAPGNHDMSWGDVAIFSEHFPASRYASYGDSYESFGGFVGTNFCKYISSPVGVYDDSIPCEPAVVCGDNGNSLQLFSAGGENFVVFHLQCSTPQPVIDWVDRKLYEYADRTAIIVNHEGMGVIQDGLSFRNPGDTVNLGRMRCHRIGPNQSISSQSQWEKCYSKHPNVMMVLCGHQKEVLSLQKTSRGDYGNEIVEICQNYPETSDSDWLRLYRFVPSENKVYAYTYSPKYKKTCVGNEDDFTGTEDHDYPAYATNRVHRFDLDRTKMRDNMTSVRADVFASGKVRELDGRVLSGNGLGMAGVPDAAMVKDVHLSRIDGSTLRVEYGLLNDYRVRRSHIIHKVAPSVMIVNGNDRTLVPRDAFVSGGEPTVTSGVYRIDIDAAAAGIDVHSLTDAVAFVAVTNVPVKRLIVDTDVGSSTDDLFAMEVAARYHNTGEANLLGIIVDRYPERFAEYADAFMNYYGLGHVPLGRVSSNNTDLVFIPYTNSLDLVDGSAKPYMQRTARRIDHLPDALKLYRRLLADAPDQSVDICAIGFFTTLIRLMDSQPDEISPLTGMELIAQKVDALRIMAGSFNGCLAHPEYNVWGDIASAKRIFSSWPTRIVCSPYETGLMVYYHDKYVLEDYADATNPVRLAYANYKTDTGLKTQLQWDPMTVLGSMVENTNGDFYDYSKIGEVTVFDDGYTSFAESLSGKTTIQQLHAVGGVVCRRFLRKLASGESRDSRAKDAILRLVEADPLPLEIPGGGCGGFMTITNISASESFDLSGVRIAVGRPENSACLEYTFPTDGTAPSLAPGESLRMTREEYWPTATNWMAEASNVLLYDKDGYILHEAFMDVHWFDGAIYATGRYWRAKVMSELVLEESQSEAAGDVETVAAADGVAREQPVPLLNAAAYSLTNGADAAFWANFKAGDLWQDHASNPRSVAAAMSANGSLTVAQCWAAGIDPAAEKGALKIVAFEIGDDGEPMIVYEPAARDGCDAFLDYQIWGASDLTEGFHKLEAGAPAEGESFFKVMLVPRAW